MVCCQGVVTRHLQRQTPSKDPQFPVLTASSSPGMVICTRRGCGVDFDPAAPSGSSSSSCFFHPGAPVFHEGSKSWSCCKEVNKPVLEFDQFMAIKGCAEAPTHSREKQELPEGAKPIQTSSSGPADVSANGVETYGGSSKPSQPVTQPLTGPSLAAAQKAASAAANENGAKPVEKPEEKDPEDATVPNGAKCKRGGCGHVYAGEGKRDRSKEECKYHKGVAVFHEGSKGWSCCKPRVLEFSEFLKIEPCTTASTGHLYIGSAAASGAAGEVQQVDCRVDHYETPADVRVTVYAKGVDVSASKIEMQEDAVVLSLALPPAPAGSTTPRRHERVLKLFATIDAASSTYNITKFKVDLVLVKKVAGQSWLSLESTDKAFGYGLTFGRNKANAAA